jgi:acyl carrier protein
MFLIKNMKSTLRDLLTQQFPSSDIPDEVTNLAVGSFPEWDSLAHFNFLLLVEENYNVRFTIEEMAELKSLADVETALIRLEAI